MERRIKNEEREREQWREDFYPIDEAVGLSAGIRSVKQGFG